jgi:hypothetical protein
VQSFLSISVQHYIGQASISLGNLFPIFSSHNSPHNNGRCSPQMNYIFTNTKRSLIAYNISYLYTYNYIDSNKKELMKVLILLLILYLHTMGQAQGAGGKVVILWVLIYLVAVHRPCGYDVSTCLKGSSVRAAESALVSAPSYFSVILTKHFSFFTQLLCHHCAL